MFKKQSLLATVLFAIAAAPAVVDDMPGVTATEIKLIN
jgi:hypothetical protein